MDLQKRNTSSQKEDSNPSSSFKTIPPASSTLSNGVGDDSGTQITCFSEVVNGVTFHFQIIRLHKQNNLVSVTSILCGSSDNTGSGIARRLVLKTGLNVIIACNIPKNSPTIEADAEKTSIQKFIDLGYTRPKSGIHLHD